MLLFKVSLDHKFIIAFCGKFVYYPYSHYFKLKYAMHSIVPAIDPLSEGLVTLPLGVEKLSPRLSFF